MYSSFAELTEWYENIADLPTGAKTLEGGYRTHYPHPPYMTETTDATL